MKPWKIIRAVLDEAIEIATGQKVIVTNGTNDMDINSDGQAHVVMRGKVDSNNSTSTTLAGNGVYTGTATETLDFSVINVWVYSNVASATDGLCIQVSPDNTNWFDGECFTIPADNPKTFSFQPETQYFRIKYTNGTAAQGNFIIQTTVKKTYIKPSSHRIQDSIVDDDDAELVKAVNTGKDPDGTYRNVNVTVDGDMKVSDNSDGLAIAKGDVTGHSFVHKFGSAPDFDTGDLEITIWDGAEDGTAWENMVYDYSTTAIIDSMSSSAVGDTQTIEIQGLDGDYQVVSEEVTLNGQTRVALANNYIRVFRGKNINGTEFTGHVVVYENTALSGGVPIDTSKIRMVIDPDNQQTEMAIYTIPEGKIGYCRSWYISTAGANRASNYVFKLKARSFAGVFQLKHRSALEAVSPIPYQHTYVEPEVFQPRTDIEMRAQSIASPAATENAVSAGFDIVLVDTPDAQAFAITVKTDNAGASLNTQMELKFQTGTNNCYILWGDGTSTLKTDTTAITHTYPAAGTYTIRIIAANGGTSSFVGLDFDNSGDPQKIIDVQQAGTFEITSLNDAYYGCLSLTGTTATDTMNTSAVTDCVNAFRTTNNFNGSFLNNADMSNVTTIQNMFRDAILFNQPIGAWNTSSFTGNALERAFNSALVFNQSLTGWDVSNCTVFTSTFENAQAFNGDISTWDTSSATAMTEMFEDAYAFNSDISAWDVSNVSNFSSMFKDTQAFNAPIVDWDLSSATTVFQMFFNATAFNQPLAWDFTNLTSLATFMRGATAFNSDLSGCDFSTITNFFEMMEDCTAFNQDVSAWDVSSGTTFSEMFRDCTAFDQSLAAWDISNATTGDNFLTNGQLSTANYDATLISWAAQDVNTGVVWHFGNSTYTSGGAAEAARTFLVSTKGWTITDGGAA